jgi:hypothetical protein
VSEMSPIANFYRDSAADRVAAYAHYVYNIGEQRARGRDDNDNQAA